MSKSNATAALEATNAGGPEEVTPAPYAYSIGISFGIILLLIIVTYCYYIYSRYRALELDANNNAYFRRRRSSIATTSTADADSGGSTPEGLDETALQAFPKLLYSQAKNHEGGRRGESCTSSACSICLQDYRDTDWLRLLPECGHFFHLKCVDPWLKLHPTCPICRNSPIPSPLDATALEMPRLSVSTR